jgi:hypothetical protein
MTDEHCQELLLAIEVEALFPTAIPALRNALEQNVNVSLESCQGQLHLSYDHDDSGLAMKHSAIPIFWLDLSGVLLMHVNEAFIKYQFRHYAFLGRDGRPHPQYSDRLRGRCQLWFLAKHSTWWAGPLRYFDGSTGPSH